LLNSKQDDGPTLVLMAETSAHVCFCSHNEAACHGAREDSWLNTICWACLIYRAVNHLLKSIAGEGKTKPDKKLNDIRHLNVNAKTRVNDNLVSRPTHKTMISWIQVMSWHKAGCTCVMFSFEWHTLIVTDTCSALACLRSLFQLSSD